MQLALMPWNTDIGSAGAHRNNIFKAELPFSVNYNATFISTSGEILIRMGFDHPGTAFIHKKKRRDQLKGEKLGQTK